MCDIGGVPLQACDAVNAAWLLSCLSDQNSWTALSFLHLHESKSCCSFICPPPSSVPL